MSKPVVVIGAGIGGLTAAARLVHHGVEVLVFEQASNPGGYLNPFKRKGFDFSPGLHLLSDNEQGPFGRSLASLGADLEYIHLPELGFEIHHFPGMEIPFHKDQIAYFKQLQELFPDSAAELGTFAKLVFRLGHDIDWFNDQPLTTRPQFMRASAGLALRLSPVVKYRNYTWQQLLDRFITNPRLQGVLSAWCNGLGLPPSRMSCLAGAGYYSTFSEYGGNYVKGGGRGLRDGLCDVIRRGGGEIVCRQGVDRIQTRGNKVTGVVLDGTGEEVPADVVISNADPLTVHDGLLAEQPHPSRMKKIVQGFKPAFGYFFLCCGLDAAGAEDNPLFSVSTRRVFSSFDVNGHFDLEQIQAGVGPFFFVTCPTSRDSTKAPPGKTLLEIVSTMPAEYVMEWAGLPVGKRGAEYERRKRWYADRVFERVEENFLPDLRERIIVQESGTPATNHSYTLNTGGAGAGMAMTPKQMGANRFPIVSHVKGLFICGSGTPLGPGLIRCAKSGWCAAGEALKRHRPSHHERDSGEGTWN